MKRLLSLVAAMLLAFAPLSLPVLSPAVAMAAETGSPEQILKALYAQYGPDSTPENPYEAYFSPDLLALWNEVDEGSEDDVGVDFDIFIDAQDFDTVNDLKLASKKTGPGKIHVDATFTAFGEGKAVSYDFVSTDAGWKIDNMGWGPDRMDLRALLADLKAQQPK
jgi:hypothetical protein